jgi:hypothetical protein
VDIAAQLDHPFVAEYGRSLISSSDTGRMNWKRPAEPRWSASNIWVAGPA